MDIPHGSSFDGDSSEINPKPLKPDSRGILDPSSVVSLKLVKDGTQWYEMKTIDDSGTIKFHYGDNKWGISSRTPWTYDDLLCLGPSHVLSFDIFVLLQYSIIADPRYCQSWFQPDNDLKWLDIKDFHRVENTDSWFVTLTDDEGEEQLYDYVKAGETAGIRCTRPLTIDELESRGDSNPLVLDAFFRMQVVILTQLETKETFSIKKKTKLSMLRDILDKIRIFSVLEQIRKESEENYLRTAAELENTRMGKVLTEFTSGMKNGTMEPVEVAEIAALRLPRIISDLDYVTKIIGRDAWIDFLLREFKSEMEKNQRPEIVQSEEMDKEVEARQKSRGHFSFIRHLVPSICTPGNKIKN